jgi:hypothetical protein
LTTIEKHEYDGTKSGFKLINYIRENYNKEIEVDYNREYSFISSLIIRSYIPTEEWIEVGFLYKLYLYIKEKEDV